MEDHSSTPLISVAICTYNRSNRLIKALDALCNQSLPQEQFEILVIDNASTDNTKEVCRQYQKALPNLQYTYEPVQGLSKARNTALKASRGEYISYLDDDAIPCSSWLGSILNTFLTISPKPIGVGGPLYPLWEVGPPDWMQTEMAFLFSILDEGGQSHWFKSPSFPYGGNVSYQCEALKTAQGFQESLGRKGASLLSCEEYLLNRTLCRQGGRFYYNAQASVQHWISQERTSTEWVNRRSHWQGRSEAVVDQLVGKSRKRQWWDSVAKFLQPQRLQRLLSSNLKERVASRVWVNRCWGYFFHVWFCYAQSLEIVDQVQPTDMS
ncbi:MAG: glycosyltransferase family 2 protein [Cyanothece sp. SIO1E1]|nr:glycosyltransferase family 2 protein [Cyanothece sp. SIO1E1]